MEKVRESSLGRLSISVNANEVAAFERNIIPGMNVFRWHLLEHLSIDYLSSTEGLFYGLLANGINSNRTLKSLTLVDEQITTEHTDAADAHTELMSAIARHPTLEKYVNISSLFFSIIDFVFFWN
jgi:hypothetical protein